MQDEGPGFDPRRVPDPVADENLLKADGRGIFFMRSFMDEVEYSLPPEGRHGRADGEAALGAPDDTQERVVARALGQDAHGQAGRAGEQPALRRARTTTSTGPRAAAATTSPRLAHLPHVPVVVEVAGHPGRAPGPPGQHLAAAGGRKRSRPDSRRARIGGAARARSSRRPAAADAQEAQGPRRVGPDARGDGGRGQERPRGERERGRPAGLAQAAAGRTARRRTGTRQRHGHERHGAARAPRAVARRGRGAARPMSSASGGRQGRM